MARVELAVAKSVVVWAKRGRRRLMPVVGGASDKYGNRYEGRWTVRCFIELLEGVATRIRLEPPARLGEGAEFVLHRPPYREFHQVKRQYSKGTAWNLSGLNSQKVLPRFRERLLSFRHLDEGTAYIQVHGRITNYGRDVPSVESTAHPAPQRRTEAQTTTAGGR